MESRQPNRSLAERLVDERSLAPAAVPAVELVVAAPTAPMPVRLLGVPRRAMTVTDIISMDGAYGQNDHAGRYTATERWSQGGL